MCVCVVCPIILFNSLRGCSQCPKFLLYAPLSPPNATTIEAESLTHTLLEDTQSTAELQSADEHRALHGSGSHSWSRPRTHCGCLVSPHPPNSCHGQLYQHLPPRFHLPLWSKFTPVLLSRFSQSLSILSHVEHILIHTRFEIKLAIPP